VSRIAVVHPTTLLGKELLERLSLRPQLAADLRLYSTDEAEVGTLVDAGGASFVGRAEADAFDDVDVALFTGSPAADHGALAFLAPETAAVFVNADSAPEGTLPAVAGFGTVARLGVSRLASAHPAAVALTHLLGPLVGRGLRRAHASVVMPVSTRSAEGIDLLFEETRALLTFSGQKKPRLFPAQIAFNLLPLTDEETTVEAQVAAALFTDSAKPGLDLSVGLAQGGIFHGLTLSVSVEVESRFAKDELRQLVASSPAVERATDPKKLGPLAAAGEENLLLGAVRSLGGGRYRLWAVMDNLVRGSALNSLDLVEELLAAGRPS
jgi:aspartate-semialdehyde dehydrogenase